MDAWVERALARWPNVPALFGWLRLDRRGRWLIRDGVITNSRIIDVINRNYASDEHGRWYFQNGPQRGYVALDYAPLILFAEPDGRLVTHTGEYVKQTHRSFLDETGSLILDTEHGPGLLSDRDLDWALTRLQADDGDVEDTIGEALTRSCGDMTTLNLAAPGGLVPVQRCDAAALPDKLGFVREPMPLDNKTD